jgi:uncharacterized cupredoxin-like copper-binding protein
MTNFIRLLLVAAVLVIGGACSSGGAGGRHVDSTQTALPAAATAPGTATATPQAATPAVDATATSADTDTTVGVTLVEYTVTPDKPTVKAGTILFIATNVSQSEVHELAVLKVKPDGSFDNLAEVKGIEPQKGGAVTLDLAPGAYVLACLIAPGESGSTVDHYQQGMHTAFTVQ